MNELIREAADFYMNVYPQLTHGVEYKKIGIALITEYPCLACEDTINPHVINSISFVTKNMNLYFVLGFDNISTVSSYRKCSSKDAYTRTKMSNTWNNLLDSIR